MSTVVSKNVQIGADGTASNNFTAYQPSTPDGTLRIGNGNSGSVTDAIVLNSSGNVGIGTSSPSNRLSVVTASGSDGFISISSPTSDTAGVSVNGGTDYNKGAIVRFQKNATTKWTMGTDSAIIGATSDNFHLYGGGANSILFSTNASERLRIDSSGNIGIGTSSPINNGGYGGLTLNGTNGALFSMMTNGTESSRIASLGDETSIQCKASTGYISFVQGVSGGTEQMRLTSTGLGIGTSSPGSKLHVVSSGNTPIQAQSSGGTSAYIQMTNTGGGGFISTTNNDLVFSTTGSAIERLRLDSSGNLGLGVTPSASTTAQFQIGRGVVNAVSNYTTLGDNATFDGSWKYIASTGASLYQQNTGAHAWYTAPSGTAGNAISFTQAMTLTSGGNLYLGTTTGLASSVGAGLYIQSSSYVPAGQVTELLGHWMANASDNSGTGGVGIKYYRVPRGGGIQSGTEIRFYTGYTYTPSTTAEVARFDQSGNMMVGTTTYNPVSNNVIGFSVRGQYGETQICTDGAVSGAPLYLNRKTNDGSIVEFRKDGTTVGSFGSRASVYGYFQFGSIGTGIGGTSAHIWLPMVNGDRSDNTTDIGESSYRFDDIYATNGTIQTSDRNEKQDIETLSEAEARVAVACKGLLRKFRWKDAVAEKGDEARIHFGIIAQDLQDAFAAEGLDAGRYAMFISSTWWEAERVVPAVEEVLDDEGNVVTEAVAQYTVVDSYQSAEEAPEGATERTRLGVRYPELLAFIIAAI